MRLLRRAAWLATITALLGAGAALVAVTSPAASAAPAAGPDGWVRIAHLSPQAPAMGMHMYPFGNPGRPPRAERRQLRGRLGVHGGQPGSVHGRDAGRRTPAPPGPPCARLRSSE